MNELAGQRVVVIGGSAGIGLETRGERAPKAPRWCSRVVTVRGSTPLPQRSAPRAPRRSTLMILSPHAVLRRPAGARRPRHGHRGRTALHPPARDKAGRSASGASDKLTQTLKVAQESVGRVRPGGSLLFVGGTGGRRPRPASRSSERSQLHFPLWSRTSRSTSRPFASTSSRRASSTRRCRRACSAMTSTSDARSSGRRFPSGESSGPRTSPRSRCTS